MATPRYCRQWMWLPADVDHEVFGWWVTRLVCVREAGHTGAHRTRDGHGFTKDGWLRAAGR